MDDHSLHCINVLAIAHATITPIHTYIPTPDCTDFLRSKQFIRHLLHGMQTYAAEIEQLTEIPPFFARAKAISLPIPCPPPVTTAVNPSILFRLRGAMKLSNAST